MAESQNFRRAFNGFNQEDVVNFIDFLKNKHNVQLNQMQTELDAVNADLALARQTPANTVALENDLAAARERCADLEAQLAAANLRCTNLEAALAASSTQLEQVKSSAAMLENRASDELAAYRRAERAERRANERAREISAQANQVLSDATARMDEAAEQFSEMAEMIADKLSEFQNMMSANKSTLRDSAAAMHAILPKDEDL
jgi:chromosome segregation ATPase